VNHKYDMIICKVEIDTCYPGGETAWKNYLSKNFRKNEVLCQMISRDTVYTETALIIFIIDKDGSITDVKCANKDSINIALQKEAIRLISEAPKWIPGQQNGRNVRAYRKEKISITVLPRYV
ncbi:MAG: energy transducer TonB, partial [Chitinophagaceae bacterium]